MPDPAATRTYDVLSSAGYAPFAIAEIPIGLHVMQQHYRGEVTDAYLLDMVEKLDIFQRGKLRSVVKAEILNGVVVRRN